MEKCSVWCTDHNIFAQSDRSKIGFSSGKKEISQFKFIPKKILLTALFLRPIGSFIYRLECSRWPIEPCKNQDQQRKAKWTSEREDGCTNKLFKHRELQKISS